jgi:NADH dehydrogenase [ubiquinone] 1 alpha subcomplex assembly factor 5
MSLRHIFRRAVRSQPSYTATRSYASQTPGSPVFDVFNRKVKHLQRDRAARNVEESRKTDYIKDEVATRLCERLLASSSVLVLE